MSKSTWTTTPSGTELPTSPQGGSSPNAGCTISPSQSGKEGSSEKDDSVKRVAASSKNLWVSGLAEKTRAYDLKALFSRFGKVSDAKIVTNAKTPGTHCYGFITMASIEEALHCIEKLNHFKFHGRIITVEKLIQMGMVSQSDADAETTEDYARGGQPLSPLPSTRKVTFSLVTFTSDSESSNESQSSSDNTYVVLSETDPLSKTLANPDVKRYTLYGGEIRHKVSMEIENFDDTTPSVQDKEIKNVLYGIYKHLQRKFQFDKSYSGSEVQEVVLETIMDLTSQLSENSKKLVRDQSTSDKDSVGTLKKQETTISILFPKVEPTVEELEEEEKELKRKQRVLRMQELLKKFDCEMLHEEKKEKATRFIDENHEVLPSTEKLSVKEAFGLLALANKNDVTARNKYRNFIKSKLSTENFCDMFKDCLQFPDINFLDLFSLFFYENVKEIRVDKIVALTIEYPVEFAVLHLKYESLRKMRS